MSKQEEALKLADDLLCKLTELSEKFVRNSTKNDFILGALQIASINFVGSVIMANVKMISDKSKQLDYLDVVKTDMNQVFEQIRTDIKSINLH